ncbi:DUF6397 family protein [Streptomyces smaragdinus]|nr:DUF6397 family protein [Streptomyces smaragdinus]
MAEQAGYEQTVYEQAVYEQAVYERAGSRARTSRAARARTAPWPSGPGVRRPRPSGDGARPGELVPLARAAVELGLRPRELEIAVGLGAVRTVSGPQGRRRVPAAEIRRVRSGAGHPEVLLARVRVVGTLEGARLLGVGAARFARLARAGCFVPVRFHVNRYRAVVWLYRAEELEEFAAREPELLQGRTPPGVRALTEQAADWRPRLWRERRVQEVLAGLDDPWARAAVRAAVLTGEELAEAVPDPGERARLEALRPAELTAKGSSEAARAVTAGVLAADHPDEVLRCRLGLSLALEEARADERAGLPAAVPPPLPARVPARVPAPVPVPVRLPGPDADATAAASPAPLPLPVPMEQIRERPRMLSWFGRRSGEGAC